MKAIVYRCIDALLRNECRGINHKRMERIWKQEELNVLKKQHKRERLWLTDGRPLRILVIINEYTRECLSIYFACRIRHQDVLDKLYESFIGRGTEEGI
jgi:putative transposase